MSELMPILRDRRSIRAFDPSHELSSAAVDVLLEAARWAPSAGNSQPWAFLVARRSDPAHAAFVPLLARSVGRWAPDASALMFTLHRTASGPEVDALAYSDYALYDLGQAVAHLTVQAASMDLATHQFAAFDHAGLAAAADVPPHWQVTTGIAIGRAIESDVRQRERRPLEEFAYGATFGQPRSG